MSAKKFKLYVDESGDFHSNDQDMKKNPSLVGGILYEEGVMSEREAKLLIKGVFGKEQLHLTEDKELITSEKQLQFLRHLQEKGLTFVIFENRERMLIVDPDYTYLNILAEGLSKLKTALMAMYGEVVIDLVIARRVLTEEMKAKLAIGYTKEQALQSKIREEEYEKRFFERMYISVARGILRPTHVNNITFKIDSAYKNPILMLSDIVCNVYLTRSAPRRFTVEQRGEILEIFKSSYYFSFIDTPMQQINELIVKNRVDQAIFTALLEDIDLEDFATNYLKKYKSKELTHYLNLVAYRISELIEIQFDYTVTQKILLRARHDLIPTLNKFNIETESTFELDVLLYQYTIATHTGGGQEGTTDLEIEQALASLKNLPLRMFYYIKYQNRKAMLLKNQYLYNDALSILNQTIQEVESFVELMQLIKLGSNNEIVPFDELGKLYGSKGLILSAIAYQNNASFDEIIQLFEKARAQFTSQEDIARQNLNLATANFRAGNIKDGLAHLCQLSEKQLTAKEIARHLKEWRMNPVQNVFAMQSFLQGLNFAQMANEGSVVSLLEEALRQAGFNLAQYDASFEHGSYATKAYSCWHMASYYYEKGEFESALEAIKLAQTYFKNPTSTILKLMEMAILAQRVIIERAIKQNNKLENRFETLLAGNLNEWQEERDLVKHFSLHKLVEDQSTDSLKQFIKMLWGL